MTALTNRQRVQVNAALAFIHASGHDASAVTRDARAFQTQGHSASQAFQKALNTFVGSYPEMSRPVSRTVSLIGASDDVTLARYDHALTQYNQTGDDGAINALAPMMAQDSVALALRNGDITEADIANGGVETALGFKPSPEVLAAATAPAQAPAAGPFAGARQSFAFKPAQQADGQPAPRSWLNGTQTGVDRPADPTHGKTGEALARWHGLPMAYVEAQQAAGAQDS